MLFLHFFPSGMDKIPKRSKKLFLFMCELSDSPANLSLIIFIILSQQYIESHAFYEVLITLAAETSPSVKIHTSVLERSDSGTAVLHAGIEIGLSIPRCQTRRSCKRLFVPT